jgi:hypothetical protein
MTSLFEPMKSREQLEAELAAWKAGPWILKHEHEAMVNRLKDQLTKALQEMVEARKRAGTTDPASTRNSAA